MTQPKDMKEIVALCKRRGFIFAASDIYGGINGFWDFGPLGTELKNNLRDRWWRDMVLCPPLGPDGAPVEILGVDTAIIQNPKAWEASGHVGGFSDPMQKCSGCGHFLREDHLWDILATNSKWFESLLQEFEPHSGYIDTPKIMNWAKTKGKKLAPNLAVVKNPDVTLSWLATRVNGQPDAPPDLKEIIRHLATEQLNATGLQEPCPLCGGALGSAVAFNMMFESHSGVQKNENSKVYLRPETCAGIFLNFKNVLDSSRAKPPFGIAQIGKAFRNEVTPRNFIFRSREFEQMELEWFCHEQDVPMWFEFWVDQRKKFWEGIGIPLSTLHFNEIPKDELAHYSSRTIDFEYRFPFSGDGYDELEGIAHRGNFDLTQHEKFSGTKLEYFDQVTGERYHPHVIEPSSGLTRGVLALIAEAYTVDANRPSGVYMNFTPEMAPKKAAILPLTAKDDHVPLAQKLYLELRGEFAVDLDIKQNIGKRYARQDEIGTPYCFTIDNDTIADQTVTVRDRNTMAQERIHMDKVADYLRGKMKAGAAALKKAA
jgi:glycyl-tRNA synthetase